MFYIKTDPGPCPVDDCPHHTCVPDASDAAPMAVVQLPARDGVRSPRARVTLGTTPGAVTTATYRRAAMRAAPREDQTR